MEAMTSRIQVLLRHAYARLVRPERVSWLPSTLHLETSTQCNLACTMCPRTHALRRGGDDQTDRWGKLLSLEGFSQILGQCHGVRRILLHGLGEPLMNQDLVAMVLEARERGAIVEFTTNAVLLSAALSYELVKAGLSHLTVSLDAATPDAYERIRRGAQFDTVIENVRNLVRVRAELKRKHPVVSVNMVITRGNVAELEGVIHLAASLGAEEVRAAPLEPPTDELVAWRPDSSEWGRAACRGIELASRLGIRFEEYGAANWPQESGNSTQPVSPAARCLLPWMSTYVRLDGLVTPCCNISDWRILGGMSIYDRDLAGIWNEDHYRSFRRLLKHGPLPQYCLQCPER